MKRSLRRARVATMTLVALLAACTGGALPPSPDGPALQADLEAIAHARILFGHQSIGRNILAGVAELAAERGVRLRIEAISGEPPADGAPGLFHSTIGENGDPLGKIDAFQSLLARPSRPNYDAALMEFCYLDFGSEAKAPTDLAVLARRYAQSVRALGALRPDVRLVHVTAPLRADPPGWTTALKRLLHHDTDDDADNVLRNEYNARIAAAFGDAALFDLARIESLRADGSRSHFTHRGHAVFTLAPEYTSDGGHLNEAGRRRAAAEFVHVLAANLRRDAGSASTTASR